MALLDCLGTLGLQLSDDLIRAGVRTVIQVVIEAEVTGNSRLPRIGAKLYKRTDARHAA